MPVKYANNAVSTLASSINATQTTITLQAGTGTRFPSLGADDTFYATLVNTTGDREIVLVTARAADTLTVTRASEGTAGLAFAAGDYIGNNLTAAQLTAFFTTQNDGASSGLDADLLDGQQGSFYQNASNLNTGTLPDGRFPAVLPATSGANLTNLNANNLAAGTIPDARLSGTYSGFTLKLNGNNTVFAEPNLVAAGGTASNTAARSVTHLASYRSVSSAATGAIVFVAPNTSSDVIMRLTITGLLYVGGPTTMAIVQGHRTTGAWAQTSKLNLGTHDLQVRLGVTPNGNQCVILGATGTTWSYPHFEIINAMFSGTNDAYLSGWTSGLFTDLTGFTNVTATLPNSELNTPINAAKLTGTVPDARISGAYTGFTNLTGSGNVDFARFLGNAADTAAAPSYTFTGDLDTGIWQPAADQLGFTTGGTNRLTISTTALTSTLNITAPTFNGALSGNATTATTLQTARTINGVSFNGSANIMVRDVRTSYAGAMNDLTTNGQYFGFQQTGSAENVISVFDVKVYSPDWIVQTQQIPQANPAEFVRARHNGTTWSPWFQRLHSGNFNSFAPTLTGVGASGSWGISVTGNASTATTLQTARTINGVSFDGSANISINLNSSIGPGNGLVGNAFNGSSAQTFTLGTPSSITNTSTNSVAASSHTHALTGELVETTSGAAPYYGARAWVNFNGTGTVAIRASGNVSSVTDNGAGDYTVNFTTAMSDANYSASVTGTNNIGDNLNNLAIRSDTAPTATSLRLLGRNQAGNASDMLYCNVAIFH